MPRTLLVEDDKPNRDILARRLTRSGYLVLTAATGEEARNAAMTELPDVVLMDVDLPDLDGWEITRQLRAESSDAVSADHRLDGPHHARRTRERSPNAGCNDFHAKPIEFTRLLQQISALLPKGDPS